MLVEPVVNPPASVHDDLLDVWRYNREFAFGAFEKASYGERCSMLLQLLQDGLLAICNRLSLDVAPFETIHAGLMEANFVYRYKNGKPVVHKKAGLSAQLELILTPRDSAVVVEIARTDGGPARTYSFIRDERPDLRFESRYLGKLKWVTPTQIQLLPKDAAIPPIQVEVEAQDG